MSTKIGDIAIGAVVVGLALGSVVYFLTRTDDCLEKARTFVSNTPAVTARTGRVTSAGTSSWLSGQAASKKGERSFYFLVKGERGKANAIVSADRATCTCRLDSVN